MLFEMTFCRLILKLTRIYLEVIKQCVAVATSHVTGRKKDTQNVFTFSWPFWLKLLLTNFFTVPFHLRMFKFWRQNLLWLMYVLFLVPNFKHKHHRKKQVKKVQDSMTLDLFCCCLKRSRVVRKLDSQKTCLYQLQIL